ncbi:MAG TPA: TIGR03118 family protein [Terriglobales bacterium]|nr:TIGR03118 family protein [Terriglobales bacterium]
MQRRWARTTALTLWLALALGFISSPASAQYALTNLTSNQTGKAKNVDPLLQNAWGLVYGPGGPFWVSDEWDGWSTLYNGAGVPQSLQVIVPSASGSGPGSPTGIVYDTSKSDFKIDDWPSVFLFATLDGTIQGWSTFNTSASLIAVNNSSSKASYTGLAITSKSSGNFLYAADFNNNKIDMYDNGFNLVKSFTDAKIPKGFVVFNVQDIKGKLYVSYVSAKGAGGGYIDIFTEAGVFVKRFTSGTPLNQPWGFAIAPKNFGPLSNTLLISNNTNTGTINGFNLKTGKFVGTIMNKSSKPIKINQLWGIEFGGGTANNGKTNQLFFTAGPGNNADGLFGVIAFK